MNDVLTEPLDLDGLLATLAGEADDVQVNEGGEYVHGGQLFAVRPSPGVVELRLGAEIAEAARRTPDTQPSGRGEDWVRFAPTDLDAHAIDRIGAWFRVAWRLAAPST